MGFGTDGPGGGPENMSFPMVSPFQILGPSKNPYPGTVCLPQVSLPANTTVQAGDNATIQVVELAIHGASLFSVSHFSACCLPACQPGLAVCRHGRRKQESHFANHGTECSASISPSSSPATRASASSTRATASTATTSGSPTFTPSSPARSTPTQTSPPAPRTPRRSSGTLAATAASAPRCGTSSASRPSRWGWRGLCSECCVGSLLMGGRWFYISCRGNPAAGTNFYGNGVFGGSVKWE